MNQVRLLLRARRGWQVVAEVSNGLEAIQKAEELRPDLVLLDHQISGMDAVDTAQRIRGLLPESEIVFLGQEPDSQLVAQSFPPGTACYSATAGAGAALLNRRSPFRWEQAAGPTVEIRETLFDELKAQMHFHFEYDLANKIVRGKFGGPVGDEALRSYYRVATLLAGDVDFRGSITDFSEVTSIEVTRGAVRDLAASQPADPDVWRPHVIVAPVPQALTLAQLFQLLGKATRPNLHVVVDERKAFALLGVERPHFQPIGL